MNTVFRLICRAIECGTDCEYRITFAPQDDADEDTLHPVIEVWRAGEKIETYTWLELT